MKEKNKKYWNHLTDDTGSVVEYIIVLAVVAIILSVLIPGMKSAFGIKTNSHHAKSIPFHSHPPVSHLASSTLSVPVGPILLVVGGIALILVLGFALGFSIYFYLPRMHQQFSLWKQARLAKKIAKEEAKKAALSIQMEKETIRVDHIDEEFLPTVQNLAERIQKIALQMEKFDLGLEKKHILRRLLTEDLTLLFKTYNELEGESKVDYKEKVNEKLEQMQHYIQEIEEAIHHKEIFDIERVLTLMDTRYNPVTELV